QLAADGGLYWGSVVFPGVQPDGGGVWTQYYADHADEHGADQLLPEGSKTAAHFTDPGYRAFPFYRNILPDRQFPEDKGWRLADAAHRGLPVRGDVCLVYGANDQTIHGESLPPRPVPSPARKAERRRAYP